MFIGDMSLSYVFGQDNSLLKDAVDVVIILDPSFKIQMAASFMTVHKHLILPFCMYFILICIIYNPFGAFGYRFEMSMLNNNYLVLLMFHYFTWFDIRRTKK